MSSKTEFHYQDALASLLEVNEYSDLNPLERYVITRLHEYDNWRDWHHPFAHYKRAHHQNSDRDLIEYAQIHQIINNTQNFTEKGIKPTEIAFQYVARYVSNYLRHLHTRGNFTHHLDELGQPIRYDRDVIGKDAVSAIEYVDKEAQVFWRTLRSPGKTTTYLTAHPDRRCDSCAVGAHCFHNTIQIPENFFINTEANRNIRHFHLRDVKLASQFYQQHSDESLIIEWYPYELVHQWIIEQNKQHQLEKHGLETIFHHGHQAVPITIQTTLKTYRDYLINSIQK